MSGHRGAAGELTVRIRGGDAARWADLSRVSIDCERASRTFEVEAARAYRDRLVLKLAGVDDPSVAASLRGGTVEVADVDRPALERGAWQPEDLEGMDVIDEHGEPLGTALGVWPTGGTDLLRVRPAGDDAARDGEWLVPLVAEYVLGVRTGVRQIVARVPASLRRLNASDDGREEA